VKISGLIIMTNVLAVLIFVVIGKRRRATAPEAVAEPAK